LKRRWFCDVRRKDGVNEVRLRNLLLCRRGRGKCLALDSNYITVSFER
jgi:hypothetical protein